jgi:hypothetical protein
MLDPSTFDTRVTIESSDSRTGEEGGANVANETADTVDSENVEGIVDTEKELDLGSVVRTGGAKNTKDNSGPRGDIA